MADDSRPDAVLFHDRHKQGNSLVARLRWMIDTFGPVLGGKPWGSEIGGGWWIARLDPSDSLLRPDHRPRYRWEDQPDGTRWGYLLETRTGA